MFLNTKALIKKAKISSKKVAEKFGQSPKSD